MNDIATTARLALLIDGENLSANYIRFIIDEASKFGVLAIRRVYGQFTSDRLKSWHKLSDQLGLTEVNVAPLTRGKNATDMKLVVEAMDMLYGRQLDGICIASSDGDFMPLVVRIRANALAVYGFGAKKAPKAYQDAFDRFFECDTLLADEKKTSGPKPVPPRKPAAASPAKSAGKSTHKPKTAREPIPEEVILAALAGSKDGWTSQSALGNLVKRAVPDFTPKKHGYRTMTDLIKAMPALESKSEAGNRIFVRLKQR